MRSQSDYPGENLMLLLPGVIIALIVLVVVPRMRVPGGVNTANLGWMSDEWLAEFRAAHPV